MTDQGTPWYRMTRDAPRTRTRVPPAEDYLARLRRRHTPAIGCRTLDVLHVATALEIDLPRFVTVDARQPQLAKAAGLKLVTPRV